MNRELAGMSLSQVQHWVYQQQWQALIAYNRGDITHAVFISLLDWADDEFTCYVIAQSEGLITWAD